MLLARGAAAAVVVGTPATPRVGAGRRDGVARELQRLWWRWPLRHPRPGGEAPPAAFLAASKLPARSLSSHGGIIDTPPGRSRQRLSRAAQLARRAEQIAATGQPRHPPRHRRDKHTMGHPDDGLFVRTDLLPTAGASHAEDKTTKTHAAGYVPPRHATPGGQKIMQYEYQEFVNAREAAKKERRPKGAAPVLPPKKVTKEGKKPPPPYVNDPTSYYTSDQLLSVDGCICDKVRVVLDERTGEPRRDYRNDATKEYGDMMNMKRSDDPLKSRTFSHGEVLFPSDRSVKREIREGFKYVEHADEWEKTILQTQGQKRTYYTQDQAMQVLRDDFRASLPRPGSACRETLRRK